MSSGRSLSRLASLILFSETFTSHLSFLVITTPFSVHRRLTAVIHSGVTVIRWDRTTCLHRWQTTLDLNTEVSALPRLTKVFIDTMRCIFRFMDGLVRVSRLTFRIYAQFRPS
jgi:hypothetical protein